MIKRRKSYKLGHSGAGCSGLISILHWNDPACKSSIFESVFLFFFRNGVRQHQLTSHCMPVTKFKISQKLDHSITYHMLTYYKFFSRSGWFMSKKTWAWFFSGQNLPLFSSKARSWCNGLDFTCSQVLKYGIFSICDRL